mgnify:CR=1 FL=1
MDIFKSKEEYRRELDAKVRKCEDWLYRVNGCRTLDELVGVHREMWRDGVRHPNFGPDMYGMFRTDDIGNLSKSAVFLKPENGAWTRSIADIERDRDAYPDVYAQAVSQYRGHLASNLKLLRDEIYDNGFHREPICSNIKRAAMDVHGVQIDDVHIVDQQLKDNKIHTVRFRVTDRDSGRSRELCSSLLIKDRGVFVPEGFHRGVELTRSDLQDCRLIDVSNGRVCHIRKAPKLSQSNTGELKRNELKEADKRLKGLRKKGISIG